MNFEKEQSAPYFGTATRLQRARNEMVKARLHFQAAVEGMREQVLNAGAKAEELIDIAIRSYFRCEPSLTSDALALSDEMNQATGQIDEILFKLLSSKVLTSSDTRHLMAYMKVSFNLESINRLLLNTADLGLSFCGPKRTLPANIPKVGLAAARLLHGALEAFVRSDGDLANTVRDQSDVVTMMGNEAWLEMIEKIRSSPEILQQALCALMIVRNLEAIVSHAKSIAESVLVWHNEIEIENSPSDRSQMASLNLRQKFLI